MKPILEVRNIGKEYSIRHNPGGYFSLRERALDLFRSNKSHNEDFWALKDVSFDVQRGESLGIIGRNGAGKSTLLKILSRITPPTKGKITARGRVASLLEVGTGFHPELTGRENIFFNGSLLGMKRREIESKFDEIVDFSGVEMFLDTPLKHYSSGMQLRLAFSVAAFLEPEILVIDEVLAVGDAEFQKKCIGKMEDVSKTGRTILFVSHNMAALRALCPRSILIKKGSVDAVGDTTELIGQYLSGDANIHSDGVFELLNHPGKKNNKRGVTRCRLIRNGTPTDIFYSNENFTAEFDFIDERPISDLVLGVVIKDSNQLPLIGINNRDLGIRLHSQPVTAGTISFILESLPLYGDSVYYVDLYFGDGGHDYDVIQNAVTFRLQPSDVLGNGKILNPRVNSVFPGPVRIQMNN
ncbi:MAG: ABC transporter ATP-binding protein [Chryseolinea sp.]